MIPALSAMTLVIWTLIGLFAAAVALRFAMRATLVDAEHLYAALSAYLLAGIFFGLFYWVLQQIWPGTFAVTGDFSRMSAIYFSFVTIATLGYGDIVPRSDVARGLAIVEGVGGQLSLAVMVARLVSLYCASGTDIRLIRPASIRLPEAETSHARQRAGARDSAQQAPRLSPASKWPGVHKSQTRTVRRPRIR